RSPIVSKKRESRMDPTSADDKSTSSSVKRWKEHTCYIASATGSTEGAVFCAVPDVETLESCKSTK
ncbi:hypothetical protein NDU88_001808, partial [Pleurodeles waltl]